MKNNLQILAALILFLLSGAVESLAAVYAQTNGKLNVYVWDFSVSNDSLYKYGTWFTDDFESELIKLNKYTVLERRRYDRIVAHQDMENKISDIENLSSVSRNNLEANKADAVFFGELKYDDGSGEYQVSVALQKLNPATNIKKDKIVFTKGKIYDNENRKLFMRELLNRLYAKEVLKAKKGQYELIDEKLRKYKARVDEVTKVFRDVIEILLVERDPIAYNDELNEKIKAYNEVWNDLNENKGKYLQDFGAHWEKDRLRDFTDIYSKIMNDFHERFIRNLDDVRIEISKYRRDQSSNKKEKENKKEMIITKTMKMTEDIRIEYTNTITPQINTFLTKLREEMSSQ